MRRSNAPRVGLLLLAFAWLVAGCAAPKPPPEPASQPAGQPASQPAADDGRDYWKGRSDLIKAPEMQPVKALKLPPDLTRFSLRNGLRVLLLPDRSLPLVEIKLLVGTGSIDDPPDEVGLADYTAGMLRQGVRGMSADAISKKMDAAGLSFGASAGYETSSVGCSGRQRFSDLCLKMVADLASRPTFPKKEMDEIRKELLSEVRHVRDDPGSLAREHFYNMLFGDDHPAGRPMTAASVSGINRKDLVLFHRKHYVPPSAVLGISGDFDPAAMRKAVNRAFGRWRGRKPPARHVTPVKDPAIGLRVLLVDKPDLSQSFFTMGHAGIKRSDPDRIPVLLINFILGGGGFSSRLMKVVRAEGGKTYGIRSNFSMFADDGAFTVTSFTRNDQLRNTLRLTHKEMAHLTTRPPTTAEINRAKGDMAGGYAINIKTSAALMGRLIWAQLMGLPDAYITDYAVQIQRVSEPAAMRAARAHVRPGRMVAAVVGKAEVVAPLLKQAGIAYEQISYTDPISAEARKQRPEGAITKEQRAEARKILRRALAAAGGRRRLARIRTLRAEGTVEVGPSSSGFTQIVRLPDHQRLTMKAGKLDVVQVLAGDKAWALAAGRRKDLPAGQVELLRGGLWRMPPLVLLNALKKGVPARPVKDPADQGRPAVAVAPAGLPSATLVFDPGTWHLVEVRYTSRGNLVVNRYTDFRKRGGVLFPHQTSTDLMGRTMGTKLGKVEINPRIKKDAITK
jgi:predicted Zn-dependent peptidase